MQQFSSVAEMMAHYKAVRERVNKWRPIPQPPTQAFVSTVKPFPIHLFIEPPDPIPVLPKSPTTKRIQQTVGEYYDVTPAELCSPQRQKRICRARQIAMVLCLRLVPNNSMPKVGRDFGNRDHTTVLHARDKIDLLVQTDPQLAEEIVVLRKIIEGA